jgi:hypothetical protein
MPSSFTWIDYSESDRRRALDTISLFREAGTVDDLGLGTVRDTFADLLFPGTSTIQTRARYFLLIPWIYLELERARISSAEATQSARKREVRLIDVLTKTGENEGVIGIEARDTLRRLPSNVYWQGLAIWGIRNFQASQEQYHRSLDRFYARTRGRASSHDDDVGSIERVSANWHPGLPSAPGNLWDYATLALRPEEASFLRERIMARAPGSLLAFLVDQESMSARTDYPWAHPYDGTLTARNREQLEHAHNFALVMHGAALLYNLMLAEKQAGNGSTSTYVVKYQTAIEEWATDMDARQGMLRHWDRDAFWTTVFDKNPGITTSTRSFINAWLDIAVADHRVEHLSNSERARQLIERREKMTKGKRARLQNPGALGNWKGETGAGAYRFSYRWEVVQTIVGDIVAGLRS